MKFIDPLHQADNEKGITFQWSMTWLYDENKKVTSINCNPHDKVEIEIDPHQIDFCSTTLT